MMSARILVLDDEESIRFTFDSFLRDEGHEVVTATSFAEARAHLQQADVDLIFSDILVPDINGVDFLKYCRAHYDQVPVIMITGFPTMDTATEALRQGAFDYIAKPVNQQALLKATRMALQYKRLHDEKRSYQAHLEAVFRSVKDGVVAVDRQLRVVALNDVAKKHRHFSRLQQGQAFVVAASGCDDSCLAALRTTLDAGSALEITRIKCSCDPDHERVMTLNTAPLQKDNGELIGAVLVVKDETRLHVLEKRLGERSQFHRIIGSSAPMQAIYGLLEKLAQVPTSVLITGESGTGKELIVDALHQRGVRREKPLVKVNCSALSENLLETELFGHVKGAFTGSIKDNPGRFELAQGGTIFLDEIGDISLRLQVKLLRVLQEKIIERVGDATPIVVDVRVVAATHQDLASKIRSGEFREDLFYRLKVVNIALPPLRERRTDIPLLVGHFIELFNTRFCRQVRGVSAAVERFFLSYHWPGNIRELEHVIEHAFILCQQDQLELEHLPPDLPLTSVVKPLQLQADPAAAIGAALSQAGGNKAKAARLLGMSRRTIYRKITEFNIPVD